MSDSSRFMVNNAEIVVADSAELSLLKEGRDLSLQADFKLERLEDSMTRKEVKISQVSGKELLQGKLHITSLGANDDKAYVEADFNETGGKLLFHQLQNISSRVRSKTEPNLSSLTFETERTGTPEMTYKIASTCIVDSSKESDKCDRIITNASGDVVGKVHEQANEQENGSREIYNSRVFDGHDNYLGSVHIVSAREADGSKGTISLRTAYEKDAPDR